jgi:hypothetical protein
MERSKKDNKKEELNEPLEKKKPAVKKSARKTETTIQTTTGPVKVKTEQFDLHLSLRKTPPIRYKFNLHVSVEIDTKFWRTPSLNLNLNSKNLEIVFLCLALRKAE